MALQDFFYVADYYPEGERPYTQKKILALRNFKNDFIEYNQTGSVDRNWIKFGFTKPFRQIYFDIANEYTLPGLANSVWFFSTGRGYSQSNADIDRYINDETGFLQQSGFVQIKEVPSYWAPDANGRYSILIWCRRESTGEGQPLVDRNWQLPVRGINYIFSDDNDLQRVKSDILDASQGAGWGPKHVAAREIIMQKLRIKYQMKNLSAFDILNPWELREASTFLTLSLIYKYELTKMPGDIYDEQSKGLMMKAKATFDEYGLSIDTNNDGKLTADDASVVSENVIRSVDLTWT